MAEPDFDASLLIVGGGPVGLCASLLLSDLGVDSLLLERNSSTSDHPKAHVVNTRSMEILRSFGIEAALRASAIPERALGHVRWVRSLAGPELGRLDTAMRLPDASPTRVASCAQDRVEACLVDASRSRRGTLRFGAEVLALEPDAAGVTARLPGGAVRGRFAIAADGASSGVRRQLGIAMDGLPEVATLIGVYFHADLRQLFEARPAVLYWVMNSAAPGTFIALDGASRWVFHLAQPGAGGELSREEAGRLIQRAIGEPLAVDVRSIRPWRMTAQIAQRYRHGRVFLAGDAAHRFPPTGGLGLNTGVQDVHNLAWKLALVLSGAAPDSLLDSYEAERRPIAQANSDFSLGNFLHGKSALGAGARAVMAALDANGPELPGVLAQLRADIESSREHFGSPKMDLGFAYAKGALGPGGGARAPHAWLERGGRRLSTLDLFGRGFVLLSAGDTEAWRTETADAGVPIERIGVGPGQPYADPAGRFAELYALEPGGAALVRPDGHLAWRCARRPAEPAKALVEVASEVLRGGA